MSKPARKVSRRRFIARSAAVAAGSIAIAKLAPSLNAAEASANGFASDWQNSLDRVWLGQDYWSNPLQDWQTANGRIECTKAALDRNVHVLTRQLAPKEGTLQMSVRLGCVEGGPISKSKGSAGFRLGIQGQISDYRFNLIYGKGIDAGISGDGALFIGSVNAAKAGVVKLDTETVELKLTATPVAGAYTILLVASDATGKELGRVSREGVSGNQLTGNLALVCNFGNAGGAGGGAGKAKGKKKEDGAYNPGTGKFWFADWKISGSKVESRAAQTFGPILFSQYTLSGGILKLTAQLPPLGEKDSSKVLLQIRKGSEWATVGDEKIHAETRTATFQISKWDDRKDIDYRLVYSLKSKSGSTEHHWTGTFRKDPVDQPVVTVGDVSCNIHSAFPNAPLVANMAKLNPDLLAFTGDQFYESSGGYGVQRAPVDKAMVDYLRKWYLHGWTWRELMKDRPSLSLPDDHDVYQGNLWGEGGDGRKTTQEAGGYDMPVEWVNVVYRTQTAHHPAPFESKPAKRGTLQYFGAMTYGRVSFAILADRQYKSGPEGKVPAAKGGRGDHEDDPNFDPKTADVAGLELLGAGQLKFLKEWAADWRGADMKSVISQTIFSAMATTHGGQRDILRADYDTNAWPQTPRNQAVREIRKAFAFHIAGDQHLPAVVQYGVDEHRDGPVAFAGPAVNVGYPRWWEPAAAPWTKPKQKDSLTGDFTDSFGHPLTVLAVKNGAVQPRQDDVRQFLEDKASGLGVVRFDKPNRKIIIECWPFLADPVKAGSQFPGWPLTVDMLDNYGRKATAHLPQLKISGVKNAVVQVFEEKSGELVYALRLNGASFQPHVFAPGKYTVKAGDPDAGKFKELKGLEASPNNQSSIDIKV